MKKTDPGTLIVFEGLDGSGKSTLAERVATAVQSAFLFRFPTKTTAPGKLIRQVFADPTLVKEQAMLYLFVADAIDAQEGIEAALAAGRIVICDRYTPISAFVYNQNAWHGQNEVADIVQLDQFYGPDLAFIIDVPAHVAEERIALRSGKTGEVRNEIYEKALEEKRLSYLEFTHEPGFLLIDGTAPLDYNTNRMAEMVLAIHKKKGPRT